MIITNPTEKNTDTFYSETSVEPNTNPTDNIQQKFVHIPETSYSEKLNRQSSNPSVELQQEFSKNF